KSSMGVAAARSQITNAADSTAPAVNGIQTQGALHPPRGCSISPKVNPARPAAHSAAPGRSTRRPAGGARSGGRRQVTSSVTATGTTLMPKTQRQEPAEDACAPPASTSAPPSSGPIRNEIPVQAVQLPIACACASPVNPSRINASELGTSKAAATPCNPRAAIRKVGVGASAQSTEVRPKPTRPAANTRLRPNRSETDPAIRISELSESRY